MKNYTLLIQLINVIEQFENEHGQDKSISLNEFAGYLIKDREIKGTNNDNNNLKLNQVDRISDVIELEKKKGVENNISRLLLMLVRHARNYAKKAFNKTPLMSLEDFSYLATLYNVPSITKSELIAYNFQEKTSGSEIIKRLILNGSAIQFDDNLDKRSKRVKITLEGKNLLQSVFGKMGVVSEFLVLKLTHDERRYLLAILQKLDTFHRESFSNTKNLSLDGLKDIVEQNKAT